MSTSTTFLPSKTSDLSSHHYIDGKYSDINQKRKQIENIRFDSNIPNDQKVEILKKEFENLNRLEHDLLLLQKESYSTLEEELDLKSIKVVVGFPKYILKEVSLSELNTSDSTQSLSPGTFDDVSNKSGSGSTTRTTISTSQSNDEIVGRGRARTLDHIPYSSSSSTRGGAALETKDSFRYNENRYEAKKLKEEIRELRAELLLLKRKKKMSEEEEERTVELEDQIKDRESTILKV